MRYTLVQRRKSHGPVGDVIWWYEPKCGTTTGCRIVKVPAGYSDSGGRNEYRCEMLNWQGGVGSTLPGRHATKAEALHRLRRKYNGQEACEGGL